MDLYDQTVVSTGGLGGTLVFNAIGINPDLDAGTLPEAIIANGGGYNWLAAAAGLEVVSSSANDTAAGSGARVLTLSLLDASFNIVTVNVVTAGTAASPVPGGPYLRVNDMRLASTAVNSNAGNITLRTVVGGTVVSYMPAGKGRAQQAVLTTPAGYRGFFTHSKVDYITIAAAGRIKVELQTKTQNSGWIVRNTVMSTDAKSDISNPSLLPMIGEKTDIQYVCTGVSADNMAAQAAMQLLLVDTAICRIPSHTFSRSLI